MQRTLFRIASAACIAIAVALLYWFFLSNPRRDAGKVAAAQDAVYEAVVRDMITPARGRAKISQLVFSDTVVSGLGFGFGPDTAPCKDLVRQSLGSQVYAPPFDSVVDKMYRLFTRGKDDYSLRADTIRDFVEKACIGSHLSQSFHTELPRTFIDVDTVHLIVLPSQKNGPKGFEQLFPGASGIISLSHVGFDARLREAIVSTSFVCGVLCGSGHLYVLRQIQGHWEIVNKRMLWVS